MNVTVAVTAYNSAAFIVETLDSIKAQTHPAIDLIVSDDASRDNTMQVVRDWLSIPDNAQRFQSVQLLEVPANTGVAANCNRCIRASKNDWIKYIAGDDLLLPNNIADNLAFAIAHPGAEVFFSQVQLFTGDYAQGQLRLAPAHFPHHFMGEQRTARDQYEMLLASDRIHFTPSYFFNRKALERVGLYDEQDRLVEDYPMWLKLTQAGVKLHYHHVPTVGYRIHQQAANNVGSSTLFKPSVINNYRIRKRMAFPHLPWYFAAKEWVEYQVSLRFMQWNWNRNEGIYPILYRLLTVYANPFVYVMALHKRFPGQSQRRIFQ